MRATEPAEDRVFSRSRIHLGRWRRPGWGWLLVWVVEVAAGSLLGVEGGWWDEVGVLVGAEADLPAAVGVVDESVVVAAEQDEVVQGGGTAVGPGGDVVGVGEAWWAVAVGEGAAAVADVQGAA
jgi:hypothetical protein